MVVFGQNWLYSGRNGCIREKMVVFEQKLLCSGKVAVFGQSGCNWVKWLYSDKVIVLGKVKELATEH